MSKNTEESTKTKLLCIVAMFALAVPGALWTGYVVWCLYGWFVVPTLSAPEITWLQMVGLAWCAGSIHMIYKGTEADQNKSSVELLGTFLVRYLFLYPAILLFGYLWHLGLGLQ